MTAPATRETADHAELARLAEAATAGPWETSPEAFSPRSFVIPTHHASDDPAVGSVLSRQDAAFIAAANPAAVLALLSEIAALRSALDVCNTARLHWQEVVVPALGDRATQAERQRDEAVRLLRRIVETPNAEYDDAAEADAIRDFLANQRADQ